MAYESGQANLNIWSYWNWKSINSAIIRFLFLKKDVNIKKVLVSNKILYWLLVWWFQNNPLHIMLPKMRAYVKGYDDKNKYMCFLAEDDK